MRDKIAGTTWKIVLAVAGSVLIFLGLVMLITPGPGLLFILVGLAVLAKGYSMPRRLLDRLRSKMPHRDSTSGKIKQD